MSATTISEVISQLDEIIQQAIQNSDRAGYFAALYKQVTVAVSNKINEGNFFADNERMEKLDVVFANRYLEAYSNYKSGKPCSASWQLAFDAAKTWKPLVIDHLMAGMNAHIGLDLGIAAATVAPGNAINNLKGDFDKINVVLNGLVNEVKAALFSMWPLSKFIAGLHAGKIEDAIAGFSMTVAREAAWQVALAYAPLDTPAAQEQYIGNRDKSVAGFGNKLLHPGAFISTVMYVFRLFEFGTIPIKIKKLDK
jgi:Family of unknown function (DUF5995)